jgi:hypothetical protein
LVLNKKADKKFYRLFKSLIVNLTKKIKTTTPFYMLLFRLEKTPTNRENSGFYAESSSRDSVSKKRAGK